MKNKLFAKLFIILTISLVCTGLAYAWGGWGHQRINHAAVFALPEEMRVFSYNHIDFITEEAVIPDVRKYINDKNEGPRHYIDMELFNLKPGETLPLGSKEAKDKYGDKVLEANGFLPWYIQDITDKLTTAFKEKRKSEILYLMADLGHYIGDAHVPLHTTDNHDGQQTGQKGIHSFWESQLPEMFGSNYNFNTGNAVYIDNIQKEVWKIINHTHKLVDSVLIIEKKLNASFPKDKIYQTDKSGNIVKNKYGQPVHSTEYAQVYHTALKDMTQSQLRLATAATANFWYTAWVNAGRPLLSSLDPSSLTKRNSKNYKKDYKAWEKGQLFGFKSEKEF